MCIDKDEVKPKRMSALEYIKSINPSMFQISTMTEEEALEHLILSHAQQRAIIREDSRKWMSSPEGMAWIEKVNKMTLEECLEYFQKETKE
jgi:hypothetical protein